MSHKKVIRGKRDFSIHVKLSENLDKIKRHQNNDWDFKELISGDGMTRTGKSTLAFQIADYQDDTFIDNWQDRVIFDGARLIEMAYKIPIGSCLVYDEAREGLDNKKQMEKYTQNIMDFFSQCGNLNHIVIIVLPEFFELPKSMAINQSIFLINCYARGFTRGYFEFYNRKDKKYLFVKGQKYLDYKTQSPSFRGTFTKYFPINKDEYEKLKKQSLVKIRNRENISDIKQKEEMHRIRAKILIKHMMKELKLKPAFIGELIGTGRTAVYEYIREKKRK